ncbi:MAG: glycosyltransferase family A protein [Capnocytophaga sp.]|nr:glycosyltransferase family A protein [Capnocytophaga sp.]
MRFGIIIPVHNEEKYLSKTLDSLLKQTFLPHQIIIVDDNSTDNTANIISDYVKKHSIIKTIYRSSSEERLPGGKIVQAFYTGLNLLENVDIICKFDADTIFPDNYIEKINQYYEENPNIGMCGGVCSIKKGDNWVIENLTDKKHLRGGIKSYRKSCLDSIGGLKKDMGWDTIDELLAKYHHWEVKIDTNLIVKHLKPTASAYNSKSKYMQGEMFYRMRYGFILSMLASIKLSYKKRNFTLLMNYIKGYFKAKSEKNSFLVSKEEGKWIRNYRWNNIFNKINPINIFKKK